MKVSVIMNCYNSDTYLKEAIDSIYAQTYTNWEIIFWDNQSTDNSAEIAQSYDDKLNYYFSESHTTLGEGRNNALRRANGELIAFLDCDDRWVPNKLADQVAIFNVKPAVQLVYSNYHALEQNNRRKKIVYKNENPSGNVFMSALEKYPVGILTAVIRKSVLDTLTEWFDTKLSLAEDYDFFMRIILNHDVYYSHLPLATYRVHINNLTNTNQMNFLSEEIYCYQKLIKLTTSKSMQSKLQEMINSKQIEIAFRNYLIKNRFLAFFKILSTFKSHCNLRKIMYFILRYIVVKLRRIKF
jgi:glycosyltransferase involved in cell wall biosynthesis